MNESITALPDQDSEFARNLLARVGWRCVPVLLIAYVTAYIDRVNVGFAAITATKDLGMSPEVFGFGAGLFFVAYLLFETPSNYLMERIGARIWLGRIMICCGLVAAAMVFVNSATWFYVARFVLGAVEAGLFPGVMLYLTYWFPKRYRARYVSMFAIGIPLASVVGAPISGLLLGLDGVLGFKGWQWLYILEAIPALIIGVLIWAMLTDTPEQARWLEPEERDFIRRTLEREKAEHPDTAPKLNLLQSLRLLLDRRVIILSIVFFGTGLPSYGLALWLPQIVKSFGLTNVVTGFVSAIPFLCGAIAMVYWARRSDAARERIWHTAIAGIVAAAGMTACYWIASPVITMIALSVSAIGTFGIKGPFLSAISESFSDKTAAVGIAMVVSIGNLSGFAAPWMIGAIKQHTGAFPPALLAVGICTFVGALAIFLHQRPEPTR
ncbi:MAG TPA: MFS transporter [Xanthobacteraceae bacterium]|nr:MFS transporter [Xanthobacteraceae bacterium]